MMTTAKFDRQTSRLKSDHHHCYKRGSGYIIIVSQNEKRDGNEADVVKLKETFETVFEQGSYVKDWRDLTKEEIRANLDKFRNAKDVKFKDSEYLMVFVMAHGGSNKYERTNSFNEWMKMQDEYVKDSNEVEVPVKWFVDFVTCEYPKFFQGKPKVLLVQACRGTKWNKAEVSVDGNFFNTSSEEVTRPMIVPTAGDFAYISATVPDFVAHRTDEGSWFIQEFCNQIKVSYDQGQGGDTDVDFEEIMKKVTKEVANKNMGVSEDNPGIYVQVGLWMSCLSKKFYLNPKKKFLSLPAGVGR